jgi:hypothetical protein
MYETTFPREALNEPPTAIIVVEDKLIDVFFILKVDIKAETNRIEHVISVAETIPYKQKFVGATPITVINLLTWF